MAFTKKEYTPTDGFKNTGTFPNPAGGTACRTQFQSLMDEAREFTHDLIDELAATTDGNSGADNTGMTPIPTLGAANTIQSGMEAICNLGVGALPGVGVVTDVMLSNTAGQIKDVVSGHTDQLAEIVTINVTTYSADKTGITDTILKITDAIAALPASGGDVWFPKGTYAVSTPITTDRENIRFHCARGTVIKTIGDNTNAFEILHSNCIVEGFKIEGTGNTSTIAVNKGIGIYLVAVENCRISNNYISKMGGHGIFLNQSVIGCAYNIVENNYIDLIAGTLDDSSCITIGYSGSGYAHHDNWIKNNFVDGNLKAKFGIVMIAQGYNNAIEGNTVKNCIQYGIALYLSQYEEYKLYDNKILNNFISDIGDPGIPQNSGMGIYCTSSVRTIIFGNHLANVLIDATFTTLPTGAITLGGGYQCVISKNIIHTSGHTGIWLSKTFGAIITDNLIDTTVSAGIRMQFCNDINIGGNILKNIANVGISGTFDTSPNDGTIFTAYSNIATGKRINIINNDIESLSNEGIGLVGTADNLIQYSKISNNNIMSSATSITLIYAKYCQIVFNNVYTIGTVGIQLTQSVSTGNEISYNKLERVAGAYTQGISDAGTNTAIKNNSVLSAGIRILSRSTSLFNHPNGLGGTAVPTGGTWVQGDMIWNVSPTAGGYIGWVCVVGGTPGTWKGFGLIQA